MIYKKLSYKERIEFSLDCKKRESIREIVCKKMQREFCENNYFPSGIERTRIENDIIDYFLSNDYELNKEIDIQKKSSLFMKI